MPINVPARTVAVVISLAAAVKCMTDFRAVHLSLMQFVALTENMLVPTELPVM